MLNINGIKNWKWSTMVNIDTISKVICNTEYYNGTKNRKWPTNIDIKNSLQWWILMIPKIENGPQWWISMHYQKSKMVHNSEYWYDIKSNLQRWILMAPKIENGPQILISKVVCNDEY